MSIDNSLRRAAATAAGAAIAASALVFAPAAAFAAPEGDGVVISEVYGGGGNSGAPLTNDFVELYNPSGTAIELGTLSLEYRSASGGSGGTVELDGAIQPGEHFLVQLAAGSNTSVDPLPEPDQTGTLALSGSNGRVFLFQRDSGFDSAIEGDRAGADGLVDMVGYGSAASFEGAATAPLSNAAAASRDEDGTDTDDNGADFTVGDPTPTNSAGETVGGEEPEEPEEPVEPGEPVSIAEANRSIGETVTVEGVVTADYREGGFNGFTIQDPAGDPADDVSDAVFVWGDRARAEIGQSVRVTGEVSVYEGLTEITVDVIEALDEDLGEVEPITDWSLVSTEEGKRAHLSELVQIDGFTVTDNYDANWYGSFSLVHADEPLRQYTAFLSPHDDAALEEAKAADAERLITLDDGRSTNFNNQKDAPLSYLTQENPVRVGSQVTFEQPFVLDFRYDAWNLQPTTPISGAGSEHVVFSDERTPNLVPDEVEGDITIANFNVLNYFPTTAEEFVESGLGECTFYTDRDGNNIGANRCDPNGPRGAATEESFERQEVKIVKAITELDASILSLQEIENSVGFEKDRDFAVATLVDALNAHAGEEVWGYAESPAQLPAEEDVIRNAFIYQLDEVETVGESHILIDDPAFVNAREPLFQGFKAAGTDDSDAFLVSANHLKSKGCGDASGDNVAVDDQSCYNGDRQRQAQALTGFADGVAEQTGIDAVFLTGDFNSYAMEDPAMAIEGAGYTNLNYALNGGEATYVYEGLSGSLDHVYANAEAMELVADVDVWQINGQEQIGFEYSRYNYNATALYDDSVFRTGDHNPIIVGLSTGETDDPGVPGEPGAPSGPGQDAPAPGEDDLDGNELAVTGDEIGWGIAVIAALLLIGGIALVAARRRAV